MRVYAAFALAALAALACGGLPQPILPLARTPDAAFRRSAPPTLAGASALRLPQARTRKLDNGLLVVVVTRNELPLVTAGLVVRGAGVDSDLPDPGVALMTTIAIVDPPEEIMSSYTMREAAILGFSESRERFADTARVFAASVRVPSFAETSIATVRRLALDRVASGDLDRRVESFSNSLLYEQPPPVLRRENAGIETIDRARLVAFHRDRYRPESSAFIVVGAIEADEAFELAGRLFDSWKADAPARSRGTPSLPKLVPKVGLRPIAAFESDQEIGHVRLAIPGPPDGDPALPAFELLAATLGGSASSRGVSSLRHHDAATYAVSAEVTNHRDGSELVIEFSTHKRDLVASLERMLEELERLRSEPISAPELQRVKTIWEAGMADLLASGSRTASLLAWRFALGNEPTDIERYLTSILSADAASMLAVARTAFAPSRLQISVVGDRNQIAIPLARLAAVVWDDNPR